MLLSLSLPSFSLFLLLLSTDSLVVKIVRLSSILRAWIRWLRISREVLGRRSAWYWIDPERSRPQQHHRFSTQDQVSMITNLDTLPEEVVEQLVLQVRSWTDVEGDQTIQQARRWELETVRQSSHAFSSKAPLLNLFWLAFQVERLYFFINGLDVQTRLPNLLFTPTQERQPPSVSSVLLLSTSGKRESSWKVGQVPNFLQIHLRSRSKSSTHSIATWLCGFFNLEGGWNLQSLV